MFGERRRIGKKLSSQPRWTPTAADHAFFYLGYRFKGRGSDLLARNVVSSRDTRWVHPMTSFWELERCLFMDRRTKFPFYVECYSMMWWNSANPDFSWFVYGNRDELLHTVQNFFPDRLKSIMEMSFEYPTGYASDAERLESTLN